MRTMFKAWVGLFTAMLVFGTASAGFAEDDDLYAEKLLPPETLFMLSVPSVPDLKERLMASSTGKLLADPELKPFLDEIQKKIDEASKELEGELGLTLKDLTDLPQGEITLAVVEKPQRKLAVVLLIDYGDAEKTVDALLEKMEAALEKEGAQHRAQSVGDIEVQVYDLPGGDDNPFKTLAYFTDEGYLVMSSELAAIKSVIDRWDGKEEETLATAPVFKYINDQTKTDGEEGIFKFFINPIGLVQSVVGMIQGQNPQAGMVLGVLPILGLDKLKGIGGQIDAGTEKFDSVSKSFVYVEQPASGVLGLFSFPAVGLAPPKWVSATAASYGGANWDVAAAYGAAEMMVDSFQGPGALGRIIDQLAQDPDGPQVHLKKDLLDQVTGRIDFFSEPVKDLEGNNVPPMVFALGVKSADAVKKVLSKAAKSDGFPGKTRQFEGATIYALGDDEMTLHITVAGDSIVLSTDAKLVEGTIRGDSQATLGDSPAYKAHAKHFPAKTSAVSFANQDAQLKVIYEQLLKQGEDAIDGFDTSKLPKWSTIAKYMKPQAGYWSPDKKGVLMVGFSLP